MGNSFLISEVPDGAEYCGRGDFLLAFPLGNDEFDIDRFLNGVQVVDTRLTMEDLQVIEKTVPRSEYSRFFEIKDKQDSAKRGEALCSLSLFKMDAERGTTGKRFDVYLDGLKAKILLFQNEFSNQKLRVYIGDNAWDEVHKAGCLEANDVDFIRMKESSRRSEIGTFWRFLAFDDYDYEYVYMEETDGHGNLVDGEWVVDENGHRVPSLELLEASVSGDVHMGTQMLPIPAPETREQSIPKDFPLFFWVEDIRLSDPLFMHRLSEYIQSSSPAMMRGQKQLPFKDISRILSHHLARGDERILYHPESNLWTNIRERHPNLNFRYIDDQWLFHLTRVLRVKHWLSGVDLSSLYGQFYRYGSDWFFKRLCDDLISDGNQFLVERDDVLGYIFNFSNPISRNGGLGNDEMFFIKRLRDYSNYCVPSNFCDKLTDNGDEISSDIQMVDPRFTEEDLEVFNGGSFNSEFSRLFDIKDIQESKKRGDALCSTNIWKTNDGWAIQPFSDYLSGIKNRIRHYREVQPNHKLRIYVADDTWDILYREKVLEADDVDFVRMAVSSQSSIIGLFWRLLAFDDYDYEYVYMEDSDDREEIGLDGKRTLIEPLIVTNEILERRMMLSVGGNEMVHIASALSVDAKDKHGDFFVSTNVDISRVNVPSPKRIFPPHFYYETAILSVTRGPRRFPFKNIVPVLCKVLEIPSTYLVYHNPTNHFSQFNSIISPLQDSAIDEAWVFYMSKLIDVKMWIRPEHMGWVEQIVKRYSNKSFFQRIHEQMVLEGNHLMCGNQGVDSFSFDRFLE